MRAGCSGSCGRARDSLLSDFLQVARKSVAGSKCRRKGRFGPSSGEPMPAFSAKRQFGRSAAMERFGLVADIGCGAASKQPTISVTFTHGPQLTLNTVHQCCGAARRTSPSLQALCLGDPRMQTSIQKKASFLIQNCARNETTETIWSTTDIKQKGNDVTICASKRKAGDARMHSNKTHGPEIVGPYSAWPRRQTERRVLRDTN